MEATFWGRETPWPGYSKIFLFFMMINSKTIHIFSPGPKIAIFQSMGTMDETYVDIEINKTHDVSISQTKHVDKVEQISRYINCALNALY